MSSNPPPPVDTNLISPLANASNAIPPSVFYSHRQSRTQSRPITPPQNHQNISKTMSSTPISNKTSGSYTYASETHKRDFANFGLAHETSGLFLGPMPPQQFLNNFLPISQDTPKCPNSKEAFARVSAAKREIEMYDPFVSVSFLFLCSQRFTNV